MCTTNEKTWCPHCGPGVDVDDNGCCDTCGADATGPGVDMIYADMPNPTEFETRMWGTTQEALKRARQEYIAREDDRKRKEVHEAREYRREHRNTENYKAYLKEIAHVQAYRERTTVALEGFLSLLKDMAGIGGE